MDKPEEDLKVTNRYISRVSKLLSATIDPKEVVDPKKTKLFFINITTPDKVQEKLYLEARDYIHNLTRESQSFDSLWELCEFLRWSEKLLLYKNNPTDKLYCDTAMKSMDKRVFSINEENYSIIFRLQLAQTVEYTNTGISVGQMIEVIVDRKYGKEMKNKFVIVDREFKCNDNSDIHLMDMINFKLNNSIRKVFNEILYNVVELNNMMPDYSTY